MTFSTRVTIQMVVITIEELELNNNFAAAKNWMGAEYNNNRPFTFFFLLYGPIWQIAKYFFFVFIQFSAFICFSSNFWDYWLASKIWIGKIKNKKLLLEIIFLTKPKNTIEFRSYFLIFWFYLLRRTNNSKNYTNKITNAKKKKKLNKDPQFFFC